MPFPRSHRPLDGTSDASMHPTASRAGSPVNGGARAIEFTLLQEARQTTQQDHSIWNTDCKLRETPVAFLSAGISEPLRPTLECDSVLWKSHLKFQPHHVPSSKKGDIYNFDVEQGYASLPDPRGTTRNTQGVNGDHLVLGTGDAPVSRDLTGQSHENQPQKASIGSLTREPSLESSSSDEIILFRGRNRSMRNKGVAPTAQDQTQAPVEVPVDVKRQADSRVMAIWPQPLRTVQSFRRSIQGRERRKRRDLSCRHGNKDDDLTLDDYIANMRDNFQLQNHTRQESQRQSAQDATSGFQSAQPNGTGNGKNVNGGSEKSSSGPGDETTEATDMGSLEHDADSGGTEESEIDDTILADLFSSQSLKSGLGNDRHEQPQSASACNDGLRERNQGKALKRDGFDFMNWERPSLLRRKGKKPHINFSPDDGSGMDQQLQNSGQKDRLKEKQRKKEREESQVLGLLNQRAKAHDLSTKYPAGMNIMEVAEELKTFLVCMGET